MIQAEQLLLDRKVDKEYAGIMGYDFFRKEAYKLAFGEDQNFKENCVRDKDQSIAGGTNNILQSDYCVHECTQ